MSPHFIILILVVESTAFSPKYPRERVQHMIHIIFHPHENIVALEKTASIRMEMFHHWIKVITLNSGYFLICH